MLQNILLNLWIGSSILELRHIHILQRELHPYFLRVDLTLGKQDNRLHMLFISSDKQCTTFSIVSHGERKVNCFHKMTIRTLFSVKLDVGYHSLQKSFPIFRSHDVVILAESFQHFKNRLLCQCGFLCHGNLIIKFIQPALGIIDLLIQIIHNTIQAIHPSVIMLVARVQLRKSLFVHHKVIIVFCVFRFDGFSFLFQNTQVCCTVNLLGHQFNKLRD